MFCGPRGARIDGKSMKRASRGSRRRGTQFSDDPIVELEKPGSPYFDGDLLHVPNFP